MAFQTGSQINPSLGATNFAPVLQGASLGAQMGAQGAASLGQGIGSLVGAIGMGAERRKAEQEAIKQGAADFKAIKTLAKGLEGMGLFPTEEGAETLSDRIAALEAGISPKQLVGVAATLKSQLGDLIGAGVASMQARGVAERDAAGRPSPERLAAELAKLKAETGHLDAESAALGQPKTPDLSFQEQNLRAQVSAFQQKNGRAPNEQELAQIYGTVSRSASMAGDPEQRSRLDLISKELPAFGAKADTAARMLPSLASITEKLNSGLLPTGRLEPFKTVVIGWAKAAGIPVNEEALGRKEEATAQFNQFLVELFSLTKGSISEAENRLFAAMGPQYKFGNKANEELLGLIRERLAHDSELGKIYRSGLGKKRDLSDIMEDIQVARDSFEERYNSRLADVTTRMENDNAATAEANRILGIGK